MLVGESKLEPNAQTQKNFADSAALLRLPGGSLGPRCFGAPPWASLGPPWGIPGPPCWLPGLWASLWLAGWLLLLWDLPASLSWASLVLGPLYLLV